MRKQQGLALITVLMIFAIVSVLTMAIVERQANDTQRSATMLAMQQAKAYVIGAEDAVKTGLYLAWQKNKETVHNKEEWAQDRSFPLSPGTAYIRIRDAQGLFNLNTLSRESASRDRQIQRFANLLNLLGIDPIISSNLAKWMDENSQADDIYLGKTPAYRAAYQGCKHTTELLLIDGMTLDDYTRLEPFIACLPITAVLNVNTAPALVLAALDSTLTPEQGEAIAVARGEQGFQKLEDFWTLGEIQPFTQPEQGTQKNKEKTLWEQSDFTISSEFFTAFIRIDLADRIATSEVLLKRDAGSGQMTTLYRDFSRREARADTTAQAQPVGDFSADQVQQALQ